jgi:hypothetical protein
MMKARRCSKVGARQPRRIDISVNLRNVPRAQNSGVKGQSVVFQADKESKVYSYESLGHILSLSGVSQSESRIFDFTIKKLCAEMPSLEF